MNRADGMETIRDVFFGGLIAATLFGNHMDDDGFFKGAGSPQSRLDGANVVSVDGTNVLQAKIFEHDLRYERILNPGFEAVERIVGGASGGAMTEQVLFAPGEGLLITRGSTQRVQVVCKATNRRSIRATVVVDDDDDATMLRGRDVVKCLPGESPGERPVADDADRPCSFAPAVLLARNAVHPSE